MTTEIIVALLTLFSSLVVAFITSMRVASTESQKLRIEIQQTYANKLLERRLDTYPTINELLSSFIKEIRLGPLSKNRLQEFRSQIELLDTKHSVLFSAHTGVVFHRFLMTLAILAEDSDGALEKRFADNEEVREFRHRIEEVELALKTDLGIYVVEFADPKKGFESYQAIVDTIAQSQAKN